MAQQQRFDVFLSHNSADKPLVKQLANELTKRGVFPWLDAWELVPGRSWQDAIERVIATIPTAAALVGPNGIGPWEMPEIRACLSEFVERDLPVIPVLLPGAPKDIRLPLFLRQYTWVDLRTGLCDEGITQLVWGINGQKSRQHTDRDPITCDIPSSDPPCATSCAETTAERIWRQKLDFLQQQEATATNAAMKFELHAQIVEAKGKIEELCAGRAIE